MYVSFWDFSCVIFGRMIDASEEAEVDEVPGDECSARIVVRWAMQALLVVSYGRELTWHGKY